VMREDNILGIQGSCPCKIGRICPPPGSAPHSRHAVQYHFDRSNGLSRSWKLDVDTYLRGDPLAGLKSIIEEFRRFTCETLTLPALCIQITVLYSPKPQRKTTVQKAPRCWPPPCLFWLWTPSSPALRLKASAGSAGSAVDRFSASAPCLSSSLLAAAATTTRMRQLMHPNSVRRMEGKAISENSQMERLSKGMW